MPSPRPQSLERRIARRDVRKHANVFLRHGWRLGTDPIPNMTTLPEDRGIKVLVISLPDGVIDRSTLAYAFQSFARGWRRNEPNTPEDPGQKGKYGGCTTHAPRLLNAGAGRRPGLPHTRNDPRHQLRKRATDNPDKAYGHLGDKCGAITLVVIQLIRRLRSDSS